MNISQLYDSVRQVLDDYTEPFLWTDDEITLYCNMAMHDFARETLIIKDSITASCCQISLLANTQLYALHESVLSVSSIYLANQNVPLEHITFTDLLHIDFNWQNIVAKPRAYCTDYQKDYILFYPKPDINYTANLFINRLPIANNIADIPAKYHPYLIDRAASLAYLKRDAETEDLTRHQLFDNKWKESLEKVKQDRILRDYPKIKHSFHGGMF